MSLSKPRSQSPVQKFFRIKASTGEVTSWDKSVSKELSFDLPFKFIVLDSLSTVGGYHEASNSSIFANEVRNTKTEPLTVRSKGGVLAEGLYSEISESVRAKGGKYAASVYIAYRDGGEWRLANINFVGAAVSAWLDFRKGRQLEADPGVMITAFNEAKKGATKYHVPVFETWTVDATALSAAVELDGELQAYLDSRGQGSTDAQAEPEPVSAEDDWSEAPF